MPRWAVLTAISTLLFGINAALIEIPEKFVHPPFPMTLGYIVWSLTMMLCAAFALERNGWKLQGGRAALVYGYTNGLLGAGGTLLMFQALRDGPAYIIIPVVSLYPVVTVSLAATLLRERAGKQAVLGVVLALAAIVLLSLQEPGTTPIRGWMWLIWSLLALAMFGTQGWLIKASAGALSEETLFFYMAFGALLLSPAALAMTDFSQPLNWGLAGPWLTAAIQFPNALAALLVIYAYRDPAGKVIIISPVVGLYPLVTIVLSLLVYQRVPDFRTVCGMAMALIAILLITLAEASPHSKIEKVAAGT